MRTDSNASKFTFAFYRLNNFMTFFNFFSSSVSSSVFSGTASPCPSSAGSSSCLTARNTEKSAQMYIWNEHKIWILCSNQSFFYGNKKIAETVDHFGSANVNKKSPMCLSYKKISHVPTRGTWEIFMVNCSLVTVAGREGIPLLAHAFWTCMPCACFTCTSRDHTFFQNAYINQNR